MRITVVAARFEGSGLDAAETSETVGHRQYRFSGDARPTMPLSAGEVGEVGEITAEVLAPGSVDPNSDTPLTLEALSLVDAKLIVRQSGKPPAPTPVGQATPKSMKPVTPGAAGSPGPLVWAAIAVVLAVTGYFVFK